MWFRISILAVALVAAATFWSPDRAQAQNAGNETWATYTDEFGTRVEYPNSVFSVSTGAPAIGKGQDFATSNGRARLSIYAQDNPKRHTPASYLREYFRGSRSALNYDRVAPRFFAVSMNRGSTILYRRCNFSANRGGTIHCIDLSYPRSQKRAWDGTVTRISRSLRPLER